VVAVIEAAARNPLLPSADIDVHLDLVATIENGVLNLEGHLTGDGFPNVELFIVDGAGASVMLGVCETSGGRQTGPYFWLPGDSNNRMGTFSTGIQLTPGGTFK